MMPVIPTKTTATKAPGAVTATVTTGRPSHRRDTRAPQALRANQHPSLSPHPSQHPWGARSSTLPCAHPLPAHSTPK